MFVVTDAGDWAKENFGGCALGDKRRGTRLVRVARDVARHAGDSLLACCGGDEAAAEGMYRLLRNEKVEPSAMAEGGFLATARRARSGDVLLAVEDTTTLSYRHSVAEELGAISNSLMARSRGFSVHSVLLVEGTTGHTVGLIEQQRWKRAAAEYGKKHRRKQRRYEDKESFKWQRAGEAVRERLGDALSRRVIAVGDREADIADYLLWQQRELGRYVVRASSDRRLCGTVQGLWKTLEEAPVLGSQSIEVPQRGGRPARRAQLCLRAQPVELTVPTRLSSQGNIRCFALLAREQGSAEGQEPLEWLLLTTEPVTTQQEALDILWIYSQRWRIEEFHKAWKSGAQVEALRPRSANNLERGAVLLAFVAVRLLQLRELVYPPASRGQALNVPLTQQPCDQVLSETEWKVLYMTTHKSVPPTEPPSAEWAYRAIAKLGGWSDTQRTGRPGWQAIWRGLFRLAERVETHLITLELCKRSDQ
jgi:hypothetical protein